MGRPIWKSINVVGPRAVNGLIVAGYGQSRPEKSWPVPSLLESSRIQHILNKPDQIQTTVLLKFRDQDQDFKISYFGGFDANTIIQRIFAKI